MGVIKEEKATVWVTSSGKVCHDKDEAIDVECHQAVRDIVELNGGFNGMSKDDVTSFIVEHFSKLEEAMKIVEV